MKAKFFILLFISITISYLDAQTKQLQNMTLEIVSNVHVLSIINSSNKSLYSNKNISSPTNNQSIKINISSSMGDILNITLFSNNEIPFLYINLSITPEIQIKITGDHYEFISEENETELVKNSMQINSTTYSLIGLENQKNISTFYLYIPYIIELISGENSIINLNTNFSKYDNISIEKGNSDTSSKSNADKYYDLYPTKNTEQNTNYEYKLSSYKDGTLIKEYWLNCKVNSDSSNIVSGSFKICEVKGYFYFIFKKTGAECIYNTDKEFGNEIECTCFENYTYQEKINKCYLNCQENVKSYIDENNNKYCFDNISYIISKAENELNKTIEIGSIINYGEAVITKQENFIYQFYSMKSSSIEIEYFINLSTSCFEKIKTNEDIIYVSELIIKPENQSDTIYDIKYDIYDKMFNQVDIDICGDDGFELAIDFANNNSNFNKNYRNEVMSLIEENNNQTSVYSDVCSQERWDRDISPFIYSNLAQRKLCKDNCVIDRIEELTVYCKCGNNNSSINSYSNLDGLPFSRLNLTNNFYLFGCPKLLLSRVLIFNACSIIFLIVLIFIIIAIIYGSISISNYFYKLSQKKQMYTTRNSDKAYKIEGDGIDCDIVCQKEKKLKGKKNKDTNSNSQKNNILSLNNNSVSQNPCDKDSIDSKNKALSPNEKGKENNFVNLENNYTIKYKLSNEYLYDKNLVDIIYSNIEEWETNLLSYNLSIKFLRIRSFTEYLRKVIRDKTVVFAFFNEDVKNPYLPTGFIVYFLLLKIALIMFFNALFYHPKLILQRLLNNEKMNILYYFKNDIIVCVLSVVATYVLEKIFSALILQKNLFYLIVLSSRLNYTDYYKTLKDKYKGRSIIFNIIIILFCLVFWYFSGIFYNLYICAKSAYLVSCLLSYAFFIILDYGIIFLFAFLKYLSIIGKNE